MDTMTVKDVYDMLHGFFKKSLGDAQAELFKNEFLLYSIYLAGVDKKFSDKEINYIQSIGGTRLAKNLSEIYKKIDWSSFANKVPESLQMLLNVDKKREVDFKDGMGHIYMTLFYQFGDALLKADGKTEAEENDF